MNHKQTLSYYKLYLRQAEKIHHYSFREYARRTIRYKFRKNTDPTHIHSNLDQLKRITDLTKLYCTDNHFFKN